MKPMWKEGLFIMPQHLQLLDEYHEQLLDSRMHSLAEYSWGISDLEIDQKELARGMFAIQSCTATMPDGLQVKVGGDQQLQGVMAMTSGSLIGGGQTVEVYLAVPSSESRGTANYAGDGSAAGTRFIHGVETLSDNYGSSQDADVDNLRPNVQVLLGHENRQSYVHIKLAELSLAESAALVVSDRYIPPCTKIRSSPALMERLSRMVAAMGAKQKNLSERYGGRVGNMLEFGAADMATFWYMHTLNTWLPIFMHYGKIGHVHPEQLYLTMASFAGQLTSFEAGETPEDLPDFQYLDLAQTFFPLFDRIMTLLGTVVSSRYITIPLEQPQAGLFWNQKIEDPQILRTHTLYLLAGGDVGEKSLKQELPHYLKIASCDQIANVVQAALPGVLHEVDLSPPAAIPIRSHMLYLRLSKEGQFWDNVLHAQNIAIYQPISPDKIKLELIAVEK